MENETRVKFGLYSAAAVAEGYPTSFYLNPAGEEVEVTAVSEDAAKNYRWSDTENRGPVLEWVRPGREGRAPGSKQILKCGELATPAMEVLSGDPATWRLFRERS